MSIFTTPQQSIRPPLTVEETAQEIKVTLALQFRRLSQMQSQAMKSVWRNRAYTPEEIMDALGTDAEEIVQLSADVAMLLAKFDSSVVTQKPSGVTIKMPGDGTATIERSPENEALPNPNALRGRPGTLRRRV